MIKLEKFTKKHYDDLISWVDNEEDLMQFAGPTFIFPLTTKQLDESLLDKNRHSFSVILNTGKTIGHCEIYMKGASMYLGRILIGDKAQRGKGLGKQIVNELLDFGFNHFDRTTAELNVFDWNIIAIECYKKVGFVINPENNIIRKINNKIWTAINMTIDKKQWELYQK